MKPYKGIVRISCLNKSKCPRSLRVNVQPGCLACPEHAVTVLDLEGREIFKTTPEPEKENRPKADRLKAEGKNEKEKPARAAGDK